MSSAVSLHIQMSREPDFSGSQEAGVCWHHVNKSPPHQGLGLMLIDFPVVWTSEAKTMTEKNREMSDTAHLSKQTRQRNARYH
ncbi:hypothetical protein AALO_G00245210 [Alosa alosa]|uniref:Uncharacterized protein n=1 Tax=Alosa alosa TaxID=278164 RepID=A0AAV6FWC9_9TELE|nr:hypothetical protein AALO_G00245210 [Alosa alosa]